MGLTLAADVCHEGKSEKGKTFSCFEVEMWKVLSWTQRYIHTSRGGLVLGGPLLSLSQDWGIWGPLSDFCGPLCTTEQSLPTHSGTDSGSSSVDDLQACCKPKPLSLSGSEWACYQESNQMLGAAWPGHNDQETPSTKNGIVCSRGK